MTLLTGNHLPFVINPLFCSCGIIAIRVDRLGLRSDVHCRLSGIQLRRQLKVVPVDFSMFRGAKKISGRTLGKAAFVALILVAMGGWLYLLTKTALWAIKLI